MRKKNWVLAWQVSVLTGFLILAIVYSRLVIDHKSSDRAARLVARLNQQIAYIEAGYFLMGSDEGRADEAPPHQVYLDGYFLDRYEITNLQYLHFIQEAGVSPPRYWKDGRYPQGLDLYPVVGVSWRDAAAYCSWSGKRLPTEAEWEKACRGESGNIFPWGNEPATNRANVFIPSQDPHPDMWDQAFTYLTKDPDSSGPSPRPVGSFPAGVSPYGVFDLAGNASEWVADYYNWDGYWSIPDRNPLVLGPAWNHVVRGSSWLMPYGPTPGGFDINRCTARSSSHGDTRDARVGFRCARSADQ